MYVEVLISLVFGVVMSDVFPVLEMCALLDFTSVLAYLLVCSASLNIAQTLDFTCILAINLVYLVFN